MHVRDLCTCDVVRIRADDPLTTAAARMRERHVGTLVVCESGAPRAPIGMITDRDIVVSVVAFGRDPAALVVRDVMSRPVVTCPASATMLEAIVIMREHGVRRLPLHDGHGQMVGIVSADDIWGALAHLQRALTDATTREMILEMRRSA